MQRVFRSIKLQFTSVCIVLEASRILQKLLRCTLVRMYLHVFFFLQKTCLSWKAWRHFREASPFILTKGSRNWRSLWSATANLMLWVISVFCEFAIGKESKQHCQGLDNVPGKLSGGDAWNFDARAEKWKKLRAAVLTEQQLLSNLDIN